MKNNTVNTKQKQYKTKKSYSYDFFPTLYWVLISFVIFFKYLMYKRRKVVSYNYKPQIIITIRFYLKFNHLVNKQQNFIHQVGNIYNKLTIIMC